MEYFDVINPDGTQAGYSLPRDEVHRKGLWHRTVHIWILNSQNQLLIQKRSFQKDVYPGLWDISCAGHLSKGDDKYSGATRELKEELGLSVLSSELQFLFTVKQHYINADSSFIDNELTDVFLLRKEISINALNIDRSEVADVKFISIDELKKLTSQKSLSIAPHEQEYISLFEILLTK